MTPQDAEKISESIQAGYNAVASDFSRTRQKMWPEVVEQAELIPEGSRVLDLGCGNGRLYQLFQGKTIEYLGIDISAGLIAEAQKKYPNAKDYFQVGDTLKTNLPDSIIDTVFSIAVLHHLPSETVRRQAINEMFRLLKPQGIAIITVWNLWRPKFWITHLKTLLKQSRLENITLTAGDILIPWNTGDKFMRYHHAFTLRELKKMLNHAGFQVMHTTKADNIMIIAKKP
jgi:ubiquinone/menaquinone biosynthesis C-methylase UbiE